MNNFWKNIIKYPQFLVSSILGIILVMLTPFRNLLKGKSTVILILIVVFAVYGLIAILKNMLVISFLDL